MPLINWKILQETDTYLSTCCKFCFRFGFRLWSWFSNRFRFRSNLTCNFSRLHFKRCTHVHIVSCLHYGTGLLLDCLCLLFKINFRLLHFLTNTVAVVLYSYMLRNSSQTIFHVTSQVCLGTVVSLKSSVWPRHASAV